MNKLSCNIVRDLLPLYCDQVLEEASMVEVENHLKECQACRELFEKMSSEFEEVLIDGVEKEVPDIQQLFKKIRIRNVMILSILIIAVIFLAGSYWKVAPNAVAIETISMGEVEYENSNPEKESEFVTYFNVDYRAEGMDELKVKVYQQGKSIQIIGKRSLFSIIKNDGYSATVGGGAGCILKNVEIIEQIYFNGALIWDVNRDGEIPRVEESVIPMS